MIEQEEAPVGKGGGSEAGETTKSNSANGRGPKEKNPSGQVADELQITIDGAQLLDDMVALLPRHLSLPQGAPETIALWVLHTYCFDAFETSPRLVFRSPVHECGKTTALTLLDGLVHQPLSSSNVTSAVIFRFIEKVRYTLIIDEVDTFIDRHAELTNILNSGHKRAMARVMRCDVGNNNEPRSYSTWAPAAIAKIGALTPALESRSIVIEMRRSKPSEKVEPVTSATERELGLLRERLEPWADMHREQLRTADPALPRGFQGRRADNWRPLLAIADAAGGAWPERARGEALGLSGDAEPDEAIRLLRDVRDIFATKAVDRLASIDLCRALKELNDERFWVPVGLARALKRFDIRPHTIRVDAAKTPKGYLLKDFEDAFARYLEPEDTRLDLAPPPEERNSATNESDQ
jgi:Protein of unknown function (DUF3631)